MEMVVKWSNGQIWTLALGGRRRPKKKLVQKLIPEISWCQGMEQEPNWYAVRISLGQENVHSILSKWEPHCSQIIAYEHVDGNRTHCHMLVWGCDVTSERLKQISGRTERGNTFWNFKTMDPDDLEGHETYITYMSKGQYDPFYNSSEWSWSWKDLEKLKANWKEPVKPVKKLDSNQRYQEFEDIVRAMPPEQRSDKTWIKLHARTHLLKFHTWMKPQYYNDLKGYVETYAHKYHLQV